MSRTRTSRKREPNVYSIDASLGVPASAALVPSVLVELLKHLQYSRGQCPAPVDRMGVAYRVREAHNKLCRGRRCVACSGAVGFWRARARYRTPRCAAALAVAAPHSNARFPPYRHAGRHCCPNGWQAQACSYSGPPRRQGELDSSSGGPCMFSSYVACTATEPAKPHNHPPPAPAQQYLQQLSSQIDAIHDLDLAPVLRHGGAAALLLGPSPLRPREAYVVRFEVPGAGDGMMHGAAMHGAAMQQQQQQQQPRRQLIPQQLKEVGTAGKRLLRSVIVEGSAIEEWMDVSGERGRCQREGVLACGRDCSQLPYDMQRR
jgi:hypothetical protein